MKKLISIIVSLQSLLLSDAALAACSTTVECAQEAVELATQMKAQLKIHVPSGAVMAFDLNACPTGWTEFAPAYGRFIRGIDRSNTSIDPDGERAPGSIQDEALKSHAHSYRDRHGFANGHGDRIHAGISTHQQTSDTTSATGGPETRPKNVALLMCRKT